MLIHGEASWSTAVPGHLFPPGLVPRTQDRDRTSVCYTPLESALFVRFHNKPGNQFLTISKIKSGAKTDHKVELGLTLNTPDVRILLKLSEKSKCRCLQLVALADVSEA